MLDVAILAVHNALSAPFMSSVLPFMWYLILALLSPHIVTILFWRLAPSNHQDLTLYMRGLCSILLRL